MTITKQRLMTLSEYLEYDDCTDTRFGSSVLPDLALTVEREARYQGGRVLQN